MSASPRILAATDFSKPARVAVARAARLAAAAGVRLDVVHVARPLGRSVLAWLRSKSAPALVEQETRRALEIDVALAEQQGAEVRAHVVTGSPVPALEAAAQRLRAGLAVVGARGARGFRDQLLGTTAERLIERLRCDVLVVRRPARAPYRKVLVGVDNSSASARALQRGVALGPAAEVHLVHAYEPPLEAMLRGANLKAILAEHIHAEKRRASEEIDALVETAGVSAQALKINLRRGYPPHVLERAASRLAPDLLAVGHRTAPLAEPFIGSVAKHMLRIAHCDVLVAHPEESAAG